MDEKTNKSLGSYLIRLGNGDISVIKDIYEIIKSIHSYECFEFAVYNITSINEEYLKWIDKEIKNG